MNSMTEEHESKIPWLTRELKQLLPTFLNTEVDIMLEGWEASSQLSRTYLCETHV